MKESNIKVEENAVGSKEEIKPIEIVGKTLKSKSDSRKEKGISCSLNQFLTFSLDLSESRKRKIVQSQLPNKKESDFAPWHMRAIGPITQALLNNDRSLAYAKISSLKSHKIDLSKRNEKHDVPNSIEMLERFLKMSFPEPFNHLDKEQVKLKNKSITVNGVVIKINPSLVFTAKIKGKAVVGAVKLITRMSNPLHGLQRKMGAHLIHQCLLESQKDFEGEVLPELCLFVDIFHQQIAIAPDPTSAPNKDIREVCVEYSTMWDMLGIKQRIK